MSRIVHYISVLFILFVVAEIGNVLVHTRPYQSEPISIWNETQRPATTP